MAERGKYGMYSETESFRRNAIAAAKDLFYGDEVVIQLKNAGTIGEMDRIMKTARRKNFG